MGTSQSSKGSPGNVPIVPPWVPEVAPAPAPDDPPADEQQPDPPEPAPAQPPATPPRPVPLAPPARFSATRRSAGNFARTGNSADLRRSLGHYVRTGYGGARTAAQRFGGTANTAGALYGVLSGAGTPDAEDRLDRSLLAGRSADDVMDAVVASVRPVDGTQDTEASRKSIRDSLAELLERFPDADLLNLTEEQREFAIERFVALDVFHRYALDIGKKISERAPSARVASARLKEAQDYVREVVSAAFRRLRQAGQRLAAGRIVGIVHSALLETFQVFEHYTE